MWCERSFTESELLTEPQNTISSLLFVVFGVYGLVHRTDPHFKLCMNMMIVLGIGSALHHSLPYPEMQWTHAYDIAPMISCVGLCLHYVLHNTLHSWRLLREGVCLLVVGATCSNLALYANNDAVWRSAYENLIFLHVLAQAIVFLQAMSASGNRLSRVAPRQLLNLLIFIAGGYLFYNDAEWCNSYLSPHAAFHVAAAWALYYTVALSARLKSGLDEDGCVGFLLPRPGRAWECVVSAA